MTLSLEVMSFDIDTLHRAYADGLSPAALVDEVYRRIEAADDPGIFITLLDRAKVVELARRLGEFDPSGRPLWGIPFVVKDNIDVLGELTTAACPAFAYRAVADAEVVRALRQAGALLVGKTNLDQFATGLVGTRSPYAVPRNAIDPAIVPGGSSSGSAVAVARGLASFSLGTDTAGSGRVPAALNNLVGLKPSLGLLSATGVVPACRTLDTVSIFALTVDDAHRALRVAARPDPRDPYSRALPLGSLGTAPARFRVGVPDIASREFYGDQAQAASFETALGRLIELGGECIPIDFGPFIETAALLYAGAWVAERHSVIQPLLQSDPQAIHPVTRQVVQVAEQLTATDAFRDFYRLKALQARCAPLLESVDLLCVPTIPAFCTLADDRADPIGANTRLGYYTNFVNLLDLCGIAVPIDPRDDGRPGNVTLLATVGRDAQLGAIGRDLQRSACASPGAGAWPLVAGTPPLPPAIASDETALAVVGAHLSGMPLNGELLELGARLLRATRTAPCYRLYALAGGPPRRPGLVRVANGAAIDVEVWALPTRAVGRFLAGIPSPLGLGSLLLEDGSSTLGFICEPIGMEGAQDVTRYGGWRSFLQSKTSPSPE